MLSFDLRKTRENWPYVLFAVIYVPYLLGSSLHVYVCAEASFTFSVDHYCYEVMLEEV